jgi:hypothetical protein
MSVALFSLNADLKALRDEGYFVQCVGGLLLMREVPYVNSQRQVRRGILYSPLCLSGDRTVKPEPHTVFFDGEFPCTAAGVPLHAISAGTARMELGHGLSAEHTFSSKPGPQGYRDYFEKMTTYANILAGQAAVLDPSSTARVYRQLDDPEDAFHYADTASARAGITALSERLEDERVAIVGVGGTGAYVLDQIAKTPVREIRLIDGDEFLQHNAFRAPGAPSIEELRTTPRKVEHFATLYGRMHRHIVPHAVELTESTAHLLDGVTFAFLCMDAGPTKRMAVDELDRRGIPFIDTGMGLELNGHSLGGILRVTTSVPGRREAARNRMDFEQGKDGVYASNIQVADLNMLSAALAVIKWKKLRGFYRDLDLEHHSSYTLDGNLLLNGDKTC